MVDILIWYISQSYMPSNNIQGYLIITESRNILWLVLKEIGDCPGDTPIVIDHDGCQYCGSPEEHQECRPQLHRCSGDNIQVENLDINVHFILGQGSWGHQQWSLGPLLHPDVGDRRPDLQHGRLLRDHADDLEEAQRSRQELETRLQGARPARVSH